MALKFWLGGVKSDKSRRLYKYILADAKEHPDRQYLVIVPEQYSLATQRELVLGSKDRGILNIDVLSFTRFAHRINDEVGSFESGATMLGETGKSLIIGMLAGRIKDELTVLGTDIDKPGYIDRIKSAISEFMQYGISTDKAFEMAGSAKAAGRNRLSEKLYDIARLYSEFRDYINNRYTTTEETLDRVSRLIPQSATVSNSVIVFDNFTGFTPVQNKLIGVLMEYALSVHVALLFEDCIQESGQNGRIREHELFYLSKHTMDQLGRMADERHVVIDDPYKADKTEISNACNFKDNIAYTKKQTSGKLNNTSVQIFRGRDPGEEIRMVLSRITKLIREEGYRYRDIAILAGDIETYRHVVARQFSASDIPFFIDRTDPVLMNPFIEYIRAFVAIFSENYSMSSVFRFLKSGLAGFTDDEVCVLENYCLAANIKGYSKWHDRFYLHTEAAGDEELLVLNDIRERFTLKCSVFTDALCENRRINAGSRFTVRAFCLALYEVILSDGIEEKLKDAAKRFEETGDRKSSMQYGGIYVRIMDTLDELCDLIPDEMTDIRGFSGLLTAGLDTLRIGILPTGMDYVQVGDLTRSRLGDVKTLFIVGANDGFIPHVSSSAGLINDNERDFLTSSDEKLTLAPGTREEMYTQQLYIHMAAERPSEHLFVSYAAVSANGTSLLPSYIIGKLIKDHPGLTVLKKTEETTHFMNEEEAFRELADSIYPAISGALPVQKAQTVRELAAYFMNSEKYGPRLKDIIERSVLSAGTAGDSIGAALAHALYGKKIISSITRLENYAKCAYGYFLKYGLRLSEREVFSFEARDVGNIFHESMKEYSYLMTDGGKNWADTSDEERDRLMDEAVTHVIERYRQQKLSSSARYAYMEDRIRRIMKKSADIVSSQVRKGKFVPSYFEVDFDTLKSSDAIAVKLSDDDIMRLRGRIDRVDECRMDDGIYVRVIDYKSSAHKMSLAAVYEGRQLQLLVYLNAAMEMEKAKQEGAGEKLPVIPAGVFYYHIEDPMAQATPDITPEQIHTQIMKTLSLKGLVNDDMTVLSLMDEDVATSPTVIPVTVTSKGAVRSSSMTVSAEDLNVLSEYVGKIICRMGKQIAEGDIAIPEADGKTRFTGPDCGFCPYSSICKNKPSGKSASVNKDARKSNSEWIELMKKGKTGENDTDS